MLQIQIEPQIASALQHILDCRIIPIQKQKRETGIITISVIRVGVGVFLGI